MKHEHFDLKGQLIIFFSDVTLFLQKYTRVCVFIYLTYSWAVFPVADTSNYSEFTRSETTGVRYSDFNN